MSGPFGTASALEQRRRQAVRAVHAGDSVKDVARSQAELASGASITTNYVSRLEGGGPAPGIDLVARLASALGVPLADLLLAIPVPDDLAVARQQVKRLFDTLLQSEDRAVMLLLTQVLARLVEATNH
jgi:transcriptional regulator with XRE-family HTH domain